MAIRGNTKARTNTKTATTATTMGNTKDGTIQRIRIIATGTTITTAYSPVGPIRAAPTCFCVTPDCPSAVADLAQGPSWRDSDGLIGRAHARTQSTKSSQMRVRYFRNKYLID